MRIINYRVDEPEGFDSSPIQVDGVLMYPIPKIILLLEDGREVVHPAFEKKGYFYTSDEILIEQLSTIKTVEPTKIITVEEQDACMRYEDLKTKEMLKKT
jgi:hypothetical protein